MFQPSPVIDERLFGVYATLAWLQGVWLEIDGFLGMATVLIVIAFDPENCRHAAPGKDASRFVATRYT